LGDRRGLKSGRGFKVFVRLVIVQGKEQVKPMTRINPAENRLPLRPLRLGTFLKKARGQIENFRHHGRTGWLAQVKTEVPPVVPP
jgi:hypothetical protein